MDRITIFDKNIPQIGLFSRNTPKGEEYAMVSEFIDYYCCKFLHDNRKNNLAVFIEPRIASGFPDVVFASFLPSITDTWNDCRKNIDVNCSFARKLQNSFIQFAKKRRLKGLQKSF